MVGAEKKHLLDVRTPRGRGWLCAPRKRKGWLRPHRQRGDLVSITHRHRVRHGGWLPLPLPLALRILRSLGERGRAALGGGGRLCRPNLRCLCLALLRLQGAWRGWRRVGGSHAGGQVTLALLRRLGQEGFDVALLGRDTFQVGHLLRGGATHERVERLQHLALPQANV